MKRSNKFIALGLVLSLVFLLFACGLGGDGERKLAKDGKLTMATNAQFPPYEFYDDDGKITGIDVEIMTLIAKELGLELVIEDMEFDSIIEAVPSGKADVGAAGMTVTPDRLKSLDFTTSYTKSNQAIITKIDSAIKGPDDLNGKKVGVQLGTTGDIYLSDDIDDGVYKDLKLERYQNGIEAVQALIAGKIDAVVIDKEPAKVFVAQNKGLHILSAEYTQEDYAIAVAKGNKALLNAINKALDKLIQDGKIQEIIDKYISAD
ncbi:MAG: basic amino acid ABC transporter substrate-binding protein [Oscillospiraceae bacterium]|jgi:polar amino acid transport system substrate-binding protein|nr:basic amino acid ABC transporter substrate-binding protein [Oscillospiraceae bacterium]